MSGAAGCQRLWRRRPLIFGTFDWSHPVGGIGSAGKGETICQHREILLGKSGRRVNLHSRGQPTGCMPRTLTKSDHTSCFPAWSAVPRWFAERTGDHEHALSLERLQRGLSHAETMDSAASLRSTAVEEAHSLLAGMGDTVRRRTLRKANMLDNAERVSTPTAVSLGRRDGTTAVSGPLDAKHEGILFVPVDERAATELDLETVMVAQISDPLRPVLNETFPTCHRKQFSQAGSHEGPVPGLCVAEGSRAPRDLRHACQALEEAGT